MYLCVKENLSHYTALNDKPKPKPKVWFRKFIQKLYWIIILIWRLVLYVHIILNIQHIITCMCVLIIHTSKPCSLITLLLL